MIDRTTRIRKRLLILLLLPCLLFLCKPAAAAAAAADTSTSHNLRQRRKLIIGGSDARPGEFPFIVSWYKNDSSSHPNCAGTLVAPNIVLTVASCGNSMDSPIRIGSLYPSSGGTIATIKETITHPLFDGTMVYDFCLLVLTQPLSSYHTPIPLNFVRDEPSPGDALPVIGFGTMAENRWTPATQLQTASLTSIPLDECRNYYSDRSKLQARFGIYDDGDTFQIRDRYNICTMGSSSSSSAAAANDTTTALPDVCYGDSGGPVLKRWNDGTLRQVGIISTRNGCGQSDEPGVHPRISNAQSWLIFEICSRTVRLGRAAPDFCRGFTLPPTLSPAPTSSPSLAPSSQEPSSNPTATIRPSDHPSEDATKSPTLAPTTAAPSTSARPSSSPTVCDGIVCTDDVAPHMVRDRRTCAGIDLTSGSAKCKDNAHWREGQYCQLSCYRANLAYEPEVRCCNAGDEEDDRVYNAVEVPSPSPTITGGRIQRTNCYECDNEPNDYMKTVGSDCETSHLIGTKCYRNAAWSQNRYCRQSCYVAGNGYPGDRCCVRDITSSPSQSPSELASDPPSETPTLFGNTFSPTPLQLPPNFWDIVGQALRMGGVISDGK